MSKRAALVVPPDGDDMDKKLNRTQRVLDDGEPHSAVQDALRRGGLRVGSVSANEVAAGLADRFRLRTRPSFAPPRHPDLKTGDVRHCPRCKAAFVEAKLGDDQTVDYCPACRWAMPRPPVN